MGIKWNHKVTPNQQAYLQAERADTILEHMNKSPSHSMCSHLSIPPRASKIIVKRLHRLHPSRNTEAHTKPTVRIIRGLRKKPLHCKLQGIRTVDPEKEDVRCLMMKAYNL